MTKHVRTYSGNYISSCRNLDECETRAVGKLLRWTKTVDTMEFCRRCEAIVKNLVSQAVQDRQC